MKITDKQKRFLVKMRKLELWIIENISIGERLFLYQTKAYAKVKEDENKLIDELVEIGLIVKSSTSASFYDYDYKLNPQYNKFIKDLRLTKQSTNSL